LICYLKARRDAGGIELIPIYLNKYVMSCEIKISWFLDKLDDL